MKTYFLALLAFAVLAQACATNSGTPANNGVSNTNSPNSNTAAVKTESSPAASNKNTSAKTEKTTDSEGKPERVEFAAGKTETHLKRTIPANGSLDFVLNARSGQRMQYSANYDKGSDTDIEVFLTEPGLQDISNTAAANEPVEFMIKKTGDHRITINNKTGKTVSVDLGVVIK